MKQQHLSIALALTEDQQVRIKPTLEQEAAEATMFLQDPILSRKEKLKRYEKLVAESDAKIKPNLSHPSWTSLWNFANNKNQS